jgi:type II secretory pathway predicted ATPase ExeA
MITEETAVDEALLELMVAYIKGEKDSSIQKKLQALQQALDARKGLYTRTCWQITQ